VIKVIALYNTASKYDFISRRFAEETLHIKARHEYNTKRDSEAENVTLLWSCLGLGRHRQKTVFVVAPFAGFKVLFGGCKDETNQLPDQREISRSLEETFQQGIKNGALHHAELRSAASGSSLARTSLADLETAVKNNTVSQLLHHVDQTNTGNVRSHPPSKRAMTDEGPNENFRRSKYSRQGQDIPANSHSLVTHKPIAIASNPVEMPRPDQEGTGLHEARGDHGIPRDEVVLSHQSSKLGNKAAHDSLMPSQRVSEEEAHEESEAETERWEENKPQASKGEVSSSFQEAESRHAVPSDEIMLCHQSSGHESEAAYDSLILSQRVAEEVSCKEGEEEIKR
jgi:hypothetical protein